MSFEIFTRTFGSFLEYVIVDHKTLNECSIIPELGGIARQLKLTKNNVSYSLLKMPETPELVQADTQSSSELLFPFASRIPEGKYTFLGHTHLLPQNDANFPAAIHGLVRKQPFQFVGQNITEEQASIELQYEIAQPIGYPFHIIFKIRYTLTQNGDFEINFTAQNTGDSTAPIMFGWHPYFQLGNEPTDALEISIPAAKSIIFNQNMCPIGSEDIDIETPYPLAEKTLDNCFQISQNKGIVTTELRSKNLDVALQIEQDVAQFKYLVVYTPPARNCIAIEPLTANVNAFNNGEGLIELQKDKTLKGKIKLRLI
jgi:aldose 1-epimerase